MSLGTIIAAVKTTVALTSGFQATGANRNVSIGDYSVLDRGTPRAVVIEVMPSDSGSAASVMSRHGTYSDVHRIQLRLMHRYEYDETTYTNLCTDAGNILVTMDQNSTLGSTSGVLKSEIVSRSQVMYDPMPSGDGPFFAWLDMTLEVTEEYDVEFSN